MAELVATLIGALLFGLGLWILALRISGLYDFVFPYSLLIGQVTVDGAESKGYAELLRARFDHHFRRPVSMPKDTGFLEVAGLDTPELFQPRPVEGGLQNMTLEVSGVNVTKLVQFVNQLAAPDQWVVDGDFQTQAGHALLALRLRRGTRVIRTWYLERFAESPADSSDKASEKATLLGQLVDDAVFQLVYDFVNPAEQDPNLRKWRGIIKDGPTFPTRAALADYYEAQGALGRYHVSGDWRELDTAVKHLRDLRGEMPRFANGLLLLGMALAEKRDESEAIHVYEQLELLLRGETKDWSQLRAAEKRALLQVGLLKATAKSKLFVWPSAHEAINELSDLNQRAQAEREACAPESKARAEYGELLAQIAAQLSYTTALYLEYLQQSSVREVFGTPLAPQGLRITDPAVLADLARDPLQGEDPEQHAERAKTRVREQVTNVKTLHERWLERGWSEERLLEGGLWVKLADWRRRRTDLVSRLHLAAGYASYRMAEWEDAGARKGQSGDDTLFGETFATRLAQATTELRAAEAQHPNHYAVLQLLGLVSSEPRSEDADLSIAEQYFERAVRANPSDPVGHELIAMIRLRRIIARGVDAASRAAIEQGLSAAQRASDLGAAGGEAELLQAEFQMLRLELEKDEAKRKEFRAELERTVERAARLLPRPLDFEDPDLTWVRCVLETRQLGEAAESLTASEPAASLPAKREQRFGESRAQLLQHVDALVTTCGELELRWVAQHRLFLIRQVKARALRLRPEIERAKLQNWRAIPISFE